MNQSSTAVATRPNTLNLPTNWTPEEVAAIKRVLGKNLTDDDIVIFAAACARTGLDAFSRQIYAIRRGDQLCIQTGIDGFRAVAESSGKYIGQDGPYWCGPDGKWTDVWLKSEPPVACKIGILRSDFKQPLWAVARYGAYLVKTNSLWHTMPEVMLAKCCEALGLRKTFPGRLAGIYSDDEMGQADNPPPGKIVESNPVQQPATIVNEVASAEPAQEQPQAAAAPTPEQEAERLGNRKYLNPEAQICYRLAGKVGWTVQQVHTLVNEHKHKDGSLNWNYVRGVLLKTWAAKYGYQGDAYTTIVEQATEKKVADLAKNTTEGDWQKIEKRIMLIEKGALAEAAKATGKPVQVVDADPVQPETPDEEPEPVEEGYEEQAALADEASGLHIVK